MSDTVTVAFIVAVPILTAQGLSWWDTKKKADIAAEKLKAIGATTDATHELTNHINTALQQKVDTRDATIAALQAQIGAKVPRPRSPKPKRK